MTRTHFLWRGRFLRIALFTSIVALTIVGTVWAQQPTTNSVPPKPPDKPPSLADLQSRVDTLQTRVDALDKDGAITDIRRELNALRADIATQRAIPAAGAQEGTASPPTSEIAWWPLAIVGAVFTFAWGLVNVLREGSRQQAAMLTAATALAEARVKLGETTSQADINKALKDRMTELEQLLVENAAGNLSPKLLLKRLFRSGGGKSGA